MMVSLKLSKLILKLDFHTRPKWRSGVEFQIDENRSIQNRGLIATKVAKYTKTDESFEKRIRNQNDEIEKR
jgi:hypothetical protein